MWFVYILRCSDCNLHTGYIPATKLRLPVMLITYIAFTDEQKAFVFKSILKGGSGRAFLSKRFVWLSYLLSIVVSRFKSFQKPA